ncbi:hypothetical protein [Mycoplasma sp. 3686d]|uniref:coiled-coil domain-containing protein n=1 Tax=Mycoplasma sp. 3686d TaxID=2967300 RepID=UPI00211B8E68|nr:hypothetical protein [Mycoplasma sp. 3686d]UUM25063.1 hypothetical protein NPA12_01470 [Mycoplasma sp. 3686d]
MIKMKNSKFKKSFLISTFLATSTAATGLGATLFTIHSNEQINQANVYGNFLESENLFKIYAPYIQVSQTKKDQVANIYEKGKQEWNSNDKDLSEKLLLLDKAQEQVFNFYIDHMHEIQIPDQGSLEFWNKVIANQANRIRELDLKQQLSQHYDHSAKFFALLHTNNKEQKQECLKNLSNQINQLVSSQNDIFNPFIKQLEQTANKLDTLPFNGLKKDAHASLTPLYSSIISTNVHLNQVEIAAQDTNNQVAKIEKMIAESQTEINEINQYLSSIEPYVNNTAYTQNEKDNVAKFINSAKINLDLAFTKADINQIRNDVVTFYQQISDTQKSVDELKQVISELAGYVEKFNSLLDFNKKAINKLIIQTGLINNKKMLISTKSDLFSEFYALKFCDQLLNDLKQKSNLAFQNNIINKSKLNLINSQINTLVNKGLSTKDLSEQLFAFYNSQTKELEKLGDLDQEFKMLQSQISEVKILKFTNSDIKSKLNELNNQVIQTYLNANNSVYLSSIKNQLHEELRTILKSNLKNLMLLAEQEIKSINDLNEPDNTKIAKKAQELKKISNQIKQDFNPISSTKLIQKIKLYNNKLQNLINDNKHNQTKIFSSFTNDHLKEVFSNDQPDYVPTLNEQKRIELYNELKNQLDALRPQVDQESGDVELQIKIENIAEKLKNLTITGNDFRKLSVLEQEAQKVIDQKQADPISVLIQPYIDAVISINLQIDALFSNPNVTLSHISSIEKQLESALKELSQVDIKILFDQKINQLKTTIDLNYPSDLSNLGAKALIKQHEQLIKDSLDISNANKIRSSTLRINQLIQLIPSLKELEESKTKLLNTISEKVSAPYIGDKTNQAISRAREAVQNADDLINMLNLSYILVNKQELQNSQSQLLKLEKEILSNYVEDTINIIDQALKNNLPTQDGRANDFYKESLNEIHDFIAYQKSPELSAKMELFKNLADISLELLDFYNLYNSEQNKDLSDYIEQLLQSNNLSIQDTKEEIISKTNLLRKEFYIIKAKKSLLDVYQQLKGILEQNKNWKIYQTLQNDIDAVLNQNNSIINNQDLTIEQIQAQKDQLQSQIQLYQTKKEDLLTLFNQAINNVDAKQIFLDNNVLKLIKSNETYQFNTYYNAIKNEYLSDKSLEKRNNVDTNDIKAYLSKLEIGYLKDLTLNKLQDFSDILNSLKSKDSNLLNKIKNDQNSLVSWIKNKIQSSNFLLQEVKELNQNINQLLNLVNLQKRIVNYPEKNNSTQELNAAIQASIVDDSSFEQINVKYSELVKTYLDKASSEEIKENIIAILENNDLTKGTYGIVKILNNELGSDFDSNVINKLNNYVSSVKNSLNSDFANENIKKIFTQVNQIRNQIPQIAQLATNLGIVQSTLGNLSNSDSNLIKTLSSKIQKLLTQAKDSYFNKSTIDKNNNEYYTNLSDQIDINTKILIASESLATKLDQIHKIINKSNFNLRNISGQNGSDKLKQINDYLTSFEQLAINSESEDIINDLTSKANSFKNIIKADQDVLIYTNSLAINSFASSSNDINDLIEIVWDSIPNSSPIQNFSFKDKLANSLLDLSSNNSKSVNEYKNISEQIIHQIHTQKTLIASRNKYRNETNVKINSLKAFSFAPLVHNDLKHSLINFLDQLQHQNNIENSLTIAPDDSGQLNSIRNQVNIIQKNLKSLQDLSTKVYELKNLSDSIISKDSLVNDAIVQANELISKAKEYYNNTDKMSSEGETSIYAVIQQVEKINFKLSLLNQYQKVKIQCENDDVLTESEKDVIKSKLNEFVTEYNKQDANLEQLFSKYFRKVTNVKVGERVNVKNSLIEYVLENAIKLKREYNKALTYISLQDSRIDNAAVKTKFNQIHSLIHGSNGVLETLANKNNNEETKIHLLNTITNNISQLISVKREQINQLLSSNNELKSYIDSNIKKIDSNSSITYIFDFLQKGINDLQDATSKAKNLSYSEINDYLAKAMDVAQSQIFDLYNRARNVVKNIQLDILDFVNDFAPNKTRVRSGSDFDPEDYKDLLVVKDQIDNVLRIDFSNVSNYSIKLDALIEIIKGNFKNIIDTFVKKIKDKFKQKFEDSNGFYVKLIKKLDEHKKNIQNKTQNLYKQNQVEDLENQYDNFKSEYESVNDVYKSLSNKNDSTSLSNFAILVDKLNHSFLDLQKAIKNTINKTLEKNPLEPIFADLYHTIKYETESDNTKDIKENFNKFKQSITTLSNTVNTENNFDFKSLNQTSKLTDDLSNLIEKINEYADWIKNSDNNKFLFNQLETDPKKNNDFKPIEENLDKNFDKKYKVIITNKEYTRKKFKTTFDSIVTNDSNANTTKLVEIGSNDKFLEMFEQFAFTNKDIKDDSEIKSVFSPLKLKVYIKKYDESGWFNLVSPTKEEVDRQSLKAKVVYSYESNNTDIGVAQVEKEVVITFKTLDKIEIPSGTSSIFINDKFKVGTEAKYEVIDVDEAGWNIEQVAEEKSSNATTTKEKVIEKVYNKMKNAIFNSSDISENQVSSNNVRNNKENSDSNQRKSAYLDKDNSKTITNYGFDFENQLSIPVNYNVSLTSTKDYEILNIMPLDNEKGFAFLQINGGYVTGFPGYGTWGDTSKPESIDLFLSGHGENLTNNIYGKENTSYWTTPQDKLPTGVNFNLYTFNIDYDPVKRKVYFYNSWTENILFLIDKDKLLDSIKKYKQCNSLNETDKKFLSELETKLNTDISHYRIEPEELAKTFSIFASFNNSIFMNDKNDANWLVVSQRQSLGGIPIYPITGGQNTVYRTDKDKPESAKLRDVPTSDFNNTNNQLIKSSAHQALYSASINKFWFKIR